MKRLERNPTNRKTIGNVNEFFKIIFCLMCLTKLSIFLTFVYIFCMTVYIICVWLRKII